MAQLINKVLLENKISTKLLNKNVRFFQLNGQHFDDKDIEKMEAFAMFCGIGIHNTKTYESTCKLMAKQVSRKIKQNFAQITQIIQIIIYNTNNTMCSLSQRVALDCLSYHATATDNDTAWLARESIPRPEEFNLYRSVVMINLQRSVVTVKFYPVQTFIEILRMMLKLNIQSLNQES